MKLFDVTRTLYKVSDFLTWQKNGTLVLSPSFQRRSVWKKGAKSYLIDTVVKGLPIPILFIRERRTDLSSYEPVREIVDGQQRIRTLISYISSDILKDLNDSRDIFSVMKSHNKELAGKKFEDLSDDIKARILDYQFSVHVLPPGIDDREVLQIFARMNSTGIKLNSQELRNAEYFGEFKTSMYETAFKHLNRWRNWKIFTEDNISRMAEVELTSEFAIYTIKGSLGKKQASIDKMYEEYDEKFSKRKMFERRFDKVMDAIEDEFDTDLQFMSFSKKTLFFALFVTFYELMFGTDSKLQHASSKPISKGKISFLKQLSDNMEKKSSSLPSEVIDATIKQTTNAASRRTLIDYFKKGDKKNA